MPLRNDDQRFLELLDKWISGDFTRTDLLEIRQLAASDPFRADAWEGFNALPETDYEAQLDALRRRLQQSEPARLIGRRWWYFAAAAAVLVLAIAVPRFWPDDQLKTEGQGPLATAPQPNTGDSATQAPLAAVLPTEQISSSGSNRVTQQPTGVAGTVSPAKPEAPLMADAALSKTSEAPAAPQIQAPVTETAKEDQPAEAEELIAVRDEAPGSSPVTGAPAPRTTAPLPAAKPASVSKAKAKRQSPANAGKDWSETDTKPDMEALRKEAKKADQPAESEPVNGWEAFHQFARGAARLTPQARQRNVSGSVRVQFSVNPDGEPQNFVFLRRLGSGLDEQAVTIIQNWAWIPGVKNTVVVEISFVR